MNGPIFSIILPIYTFIKRRHRLKKSTQACVHSLASADH